MMPLISAGNRSIVKIYLVISNRFQKPIYVSGPEHFKLMLQLSHRSGAILSFGGHSAAFERDKRERQNDLQTRLWL
jgi:hypothetical protein